MGKQRIAEGSSRDSQRKPIPPKRIYYVYETVAKIISKALNQEGTLRSLVYEHAKTLLKTHLRLSIEVVRHRNLLERLVTETGLAEKEGLEPILAQVLVYELVLGERKTLPSDLEIFDRVTEHHHALKKALKKIRTSGDIEKLVVDKPEATVPRYGRINTLVASLESVVENLQRRGFTLVDTEGKSYQEFLDCVSQLEEKQFVLDFHFPRDLLVFNPSQLLANLFVYKAGHLVVQDKTSYFPVACLAPPPGSVVLDACAAPGMKTIHIAAKMKNEGTIYAFDPHESRFANLESNLYLSGVTCCTAKCLDITCVHPLKPPYDRVAYVLLDPPCTGSGIVNRLDNLTDTADSKSSDRVRRLSALQFKLLCHTAKFPNVKRIVYSTCSVEVQENEQVIKDFIDKNQDRFMVVDALPDWPTRGRQEFQFGKQCIRSSKTDLTNGFFVAVLERNDSGVVPDASTPRKKFQEQLNQKQSKSNASFTCKTSNEPEATGLELKGKQNAGRKGKRIYVRKRLKRGKREREMCKSVSDFPGESGKKSGTTNSSKSTNDEHIVDLVTKKQKKSEKHKNADLAFERGELSNSKKKEKKKDEKVNLEDKQIQDLTGTDSKKFKEQKKKKDVLVSDKFGNECPHVESGTGKSEQAAVANCLEKKHPVPNGDDDPFKESVKKRKKHKKKDKKYGNFSVEDENFKQDASSDGLVMGSEEFQHRKKKQVTSDADLEGEDLNKFESSQDFHQLVIKEEESSTLLKTNSHKRSKKKKRNKELKHDETDRAESPEQNRIETKLQTSASNASILILSVNPKKHVSSITLDDTLDKANVSSKNMAIAGKEKETVAARPETVLKKRKTTSLAFEPNVQADDKEMPHKPKKKKKSRNDEMSAGADELQKTMSTVDQSESAEPPHKKRNKKKTNEDPIEEIHMKNFKNMVICEDSGLSDANNFSGHNKKKKKRKSKEK